VTTTRSVSARISELQKDVKGEIQEAREVKMWDLANDCRFGGAYLAERGLIRRAEQYGGGFGERGFPMLKFWDCRSGGPASRNGTFLV
jgi:hypothetical protein